MFEHRRQSLLSKRAFYRRVAFSLFTASLLIVFALTIGVIGYHVSEGFSWVDSLLNASMILSGMGPASELHTQAGKYFASFYALFSGVAFITTIGVFFAPIVHRYLHKFHLEVSDKD